MTALDNPNLLAEMREFGESLAPDIGPMFGRDVARLIAEIAQHKQKVERLIAAGEHKRELYNSDGLDNWSDWDEAVADLTEQDKGGDDGTS
jgi:hypothetical protein